MSHFSPFQQTRDQNSQTAHRSLCLNPVLSGHAVRFGLLCLSLTLSASAYAQNLSGISVATGNVPAAESTPPAALAAQHSVVRWTGILPSAAGKTVQMQFSIYAEQSRGLSLWNETQSVKVDADGRYSVLLGASSAEGLPESLFPAGEPRWVEAHPSSESVETTRSLIAAVPYAYKSIDAETLAGRAAADYLTRDDLQSIANSPKSINPVQLNPVHISPDISGTGSTNYLPIWTNSTTFGDSILYQTGGFLGVGTTTPASVLDLNGGATVRGLLDLPAAGTATASVGAVSHTLQFKASAYNSSSAAAVAQIFKLEALPVANNTSAPSANLQLQFGSGTTTPTATGLSIASNGKITFAAGQTFPGTGAITGIATTSPLTGSGTSGTVTIGLNTATLETTLNGKYAQLAAANNFTSSGTFAGPITGNSGSTMYAIQGNTSGGSGVQGYATGTGGWGVNGYSTGNGGVGVYGNATGNANGSTYPIGVLAHVFSGTGVKSSLDEALIGQTAILGQTNGVSAQYTSFLTDGLVGGVWGDVANSSTEVPMAIAGTADNGYSGVFENTSTTWSTIYVYNKGGGSTGQALPREGSGLGLATAGHFSTLMAGSPAGTCGIGGNGDLSCTGQMKSLVSTRGGQRTVETYSMQSPENWMEDFGDAELHDGSTVVTIDPDFAETASATAKYHVFLTPRGDSKGLYVTNLTPTSFEVHESGGGTASIAFDYRIVGKRRGFEAQRMTDVTERLKAEIAATPGAKHTPTISKP